MANIYLVHVGTAAEDRTVAVACATKGIAEAYKKVFDERQNEDVTIVEMEIEYFLPNSNPIWTCRSSVDQARTVEFVALQPSLLVPSCVELASGYLYVNVRAANLTEAAEQAAVLFNAFKEVDQG